MKTNINHIAKAISAALALSLSYGVNATEIAAQTNNYQPLTEIPGANNDTVTLGTAYHSEKQGFFSLKSVNGLVDETYGNTEMDFTVGVDMSYSQLANMLDGSLGASLAIKGVKVGVGASYAKQNAADDYTGTYTLFLQLKPKKKMLVPMDANGYQVTRAAQDLIDAYPGDKFNNIGDEFVSAIEYGSQVMVNLQFQYKNAADKVKFGGQLSVDWLGKVKVGGSLEKVDADVKRNIKITVSALQQGGDPTRLLTVIPDQLVECTLDNPKPCFDIFENTITYIKSDYINQFNSLDKYNVSKVFTDKYRFSGPSLSTMVPDDLYPRKTVLTKIAIKNMSELWIQSILDNRRAENLLNYYASILSADDKSKLEQLKDNALFNSFLLADSVSYCNRNPVGDYCRNREQQTMSSYINYDRSLLEL